jgi:hypothetical protein
MPKLQFSEPNKISQAPNSIKNELSNFFDFGIAKTETGDAVSEKPGQIAVNKSGIEVQVYVDTPFANDEASLRFVSTNNNPLPISNYNFQAAVTKVLITFSILIEV